jgi:Protein of unknown function (DUF2628)
VSEQAGEINPYEAPRAVLDGATDQTGAMTREEFMAFAGGGGAFYWSQWTRAGQRPRLWLGWNWPAALVPYPWFAYRKMWRELGALLILSIAWDVLHLLASWLLERDVSLGAWLDVLLWLLVYGLLGNRLYLRRARLEVAKVRQAFPEDPARQAAQLGSVGGTSGWWLLAGIGLNVAAFVLQGRLTSTLLGWLF